MTDSDANTMHARVQEARNIRRAALQLTESARGNLEAVGNLLGGHTLEQPRTGDLLTFQTDLELVGTQLHIFRNRVQEFLTPDAATALVDVANQLQADTQLILQDAGDRLLVTKAELESEIRQLRVDVLDETRRGMVVVMEAVSVLDRLVRHLSQRRWHWSAHEPLRVSVRQGTSELLTAMRELLDDISERQQRITLALNPEVAQ